MTGTETMIGQAMSSAGDGVAALGPVRRSVRVRANVEKAFRVFAQEMGSWWPKTHHIGNSPMKDIVVEGRAGGAIYTLQEDGTNCPWGTVKAWEPPHRIVLAWQVGPTWQYVPDPAQCSEVEVQFTPADDGTTLVELEHRDFERHGEGWTGVREAVGGDGGWNGVLALFVAKVEEGA